MRNHVEPRQVRRRRKPGTLPNGLDWGRDFPYGFYRCADGRVAIFNRRYRPMLIRLPDGRVVRPPPGEPLWLDGIVQQWWLYKDDGVDSPAVCLRTQRTIVLALNDFIDGKVPKPKSIKPIHLVVDLQ